MSVLVRNVSFRGEVGDYLIGANPLERLGSHEREIDATGLVMVPAFEDDHVHFRDPGLTHKEDLVSGARAAAAGGYRAVTCEPNTRPVIDTLEAIEAFEANVAAHDVPVRVDTKCALTIGQLGRELVDLRGIIDARPPMHFSSDGEPVADRDILVQAFRWSRRWTRIDLHCEETPRSSDELRARLGDGPAMAREPELVALALDALREADGGHLRIQHVSLADTAALIAEAKEQGLNVTAEVTPHHLLLCEEDIAQRGDGPDPNWKMNPPLRSRADMMAMRKALADGVIDVIATDHAPHAPDEKALPWGAAPFGIIGLETAFGACMSLVHGDELTFGRLISAMQVISIEHYGGNSVTLIDPNHVWTVDPDKFYSKSRNCPFAGMTFKGKPMYTIINGRVVMAEGEVLF